MAALLSLAQVPPLWSPIPRTSPNTGPWAGKCLPDACVVSDPTSSCRWELVGFRAPDLSNCMKPRISLRLTEQAHCEGSSQLHAEDLERVTREGKKPVPKAGRQREKRPDLQRTFMSLSQPNCREAKSQRAEKMLGRRAALQLTLHMGVAGGRRGEEGPTRSIVVDEGGGEGTAGPLGLDER